jgi:hypothetical protein
MASVWPSTLMRFQQFKGMVSRTLAHYSDGPWVPLRTTWSLGRLCDRQRRDWVISGNLYGATFSHNRDADKTRIV